MMDKIIVGVSSIIIGVTTIVATQIIDPPKMIVLTSNWCSTITPPPPDYLGGILTIIGTVIVASGIIFMLIKWS